MVDTANSHFFSWSWKSFDASRLSAASRLASCSSLVAPKTKILSRYVMMPLRPARFWATKCWKTTRFGQSHGQTLVPEEALVRNCCCVVSTPFCQLSMEVAFPQIHFGKNAGSMKFQEQILNVWQWISIWDYELIQWWKVCCDSVGSIRFRHCDQLMLPQWFVDWLPNVVIDELLDLSRHRFSMSQGDGSNFSRSQPGFCC